MTQATRGTRAQELPNKLLELPRGFFSSMQMNILPAIIGSLVFISTLVMQGDSAQKAEANSPASPRFYMSYLIAERQTTELEEHHILIQFGIDAGRRLTYDYSDWVIGAKTKQAVSTRFHAPHGMTISDEEVKALIAHLEDIHIYDFRSDPEPEGDTHYEGAWSCWTMHGIFVLLSIIRHRPQAD